MFHSLHRLHPRSRFISFGASILTVVNRDFFCPAIISRFQINDDGVFSDGSGSCFNDTVILSSRGWGFGSSRSTLTGEVLEF